MRRDTTIRLLLLPSLLAALTVAGCQKPRNTGQIVLVEGENAYRSANYGAAVDRLTAYLDQYPGAPYRARAHYVRGMAAARSGQRRLAYSDLEQAAETRADPQVTWSAAAVLGVLHFEDEHWDTAAYWLEKALRDMPSVAPMDALLFRLGLCRERTEHWGAAQAAFQRIVSQFPRGRYTDLARRRLELEAAAYSVQCGVFSNPRNAEQLEAQLRRDGLEPRVEQEVRDGRPYYVVLVGRYTDYGAAREALARVKGYVPQAVLWP